MSKQAGAATLIGAIRALYQCERFVDGPAHGSEPPPELSTREHEVVRLLASGYTSRAIAEALGISKSSVDTYRARIFAKLGVANRAELIAWRGRATGAAELE